MEGYGDNEPLINYPSMQLNGSKIEKNPGKIEFIDLIVNELDQYQLLIYNIIKINCL